MKTPHGLVIEFQHSPKDFDKLFSREAFYQNMIWVVDGDRSSLEPSYFNLGFSLEPLTFRPLTYGVKWYGQNMLMPKWAGATALVYIDFGNEEKYASFNISGPSMKSEPFR